MDYFGKHILFSGIHRFFNNGVCVALNRKKLTAYGRAVKLRLLEREMSQVELAGQLGCSRQYLTRILVGERSGSKYIERIEEILGAINVEDRSDNSFDIDFQ